MGYRLAFGLRYFWDEDARQIYLLGLKYATTGAWPAYGPDVVYTQSQIPGALQGLLIGVPLRLAPVPEAPFVLLNVLSLAALLFLGWYIRRRLPELPAWFVYGTLLTLPWTAYVGVRTVNPDYVLTGAVLAAVGLYEAAPSLRRGILPDSLAWGLAGFGVTWVMQLHLSWVVLLPLVGFAVIDAARRSPGRLPLRLGSLALGALVPMALLLPTLLTNGLGGVGSNATWAGTNPVTLLLTITARFLSFASYELPYFMGGHTADRIAFVTRHWWAAPALLLLLLVGHLQPIVLLAEGFRKHDRSEWAAVRGITLLLLATLVAAFLVSVKGPSSHTFSVAAPLAILYAMYCWPRYLARRPWRRLAATVIVAGGLVSLAFFFEYHPDRSFAADRDRAAGALQAGDYRVLGERRSTAWGCCY